MKLLETDVRHMVRLLGEIAVLKGGISEKKRYLMEGLCRIIDADAWAWALSCQREPDKPQVYVSLLKGGLSEERFVKLLEAVEHPEMVEVTGHFFQEVNERQEHLTRLRSQITPDLEKFNRSPAAEAWKRADIGPVIMSLRPLDAQSGSTIAIYRAFGRPEFSPREARIAHIVLTELAWLHERGWPEDRGRTVPVLSRRQRLALNLLTSGEGSKQIAARMDVSVHTAQGYIKEIYRHFGVHSQAQLMNRFFQGNGHDVA
jgi:DNA-binding CsgD family transcriptional regulator